MADNLDDAAAAALYMLGLTQPQTFEHLGLLYEENGKLERTPTQSSNDRERARARFSVPPGSLRGLFHNHPLGRYENADRSRRAEFSSDDIEQAQALRVPSYISAGDRVMRYDPKTERSEEVLAEFPWDEFKQWISRRYTLGGAQ